MGRLIQRLVTSSLFALSLYSAPYTARDFSKLPDRVTGLHPTLLSMHITLYEGYVKNTNALLEALDTVDPSSIAFGALKRRFGWEYDGMVLHERYFEALGPAFPLPSTDPLYQAIVDSFGSYEAWERNFRSTGLIRGIGWVILYRDPQEGRLYNVWINEHDLGHLAGGELILVMDVWEHAYITQFGLDRATYIDTFIKNINWNFVSKKFKN